ncbi:hypothetical protein LOC68_19840 [Blastopirellula sp. JC732]|uniref:Uncharacterized protein n=1 Tax=Blastopirellula sediminis TaxID=2894196 RepID=A0A9X1MNY1_9BACT|nr:hypothetical protein [Blastopirellula sediminis]MCC9606048.1 hypothetical protein [Blastopirellula sediminis]MCC9630653.1 hypothetical protein [Blastopirellula sediminis]
MHDALEQPEETRVKRRELPPQEEPSRWRFSVTRLIVATAMAPLPYWMIPTNDEAARIALAVSSLAVAGFVLLVRARHLPRINLTLQLGMLGMLFSSCCFPWHLLPFAPALGLACSFAVAFFLTEAIFPSRVVNGRQPITPKVKSVLKTGMFPFGFLFLIVILMTVMMPAGRSDSGVVFLKMLAIDLLMLVLLGLNVDAWIHGVDKTLDERPDLGYRYEATTLLLPVAAIVIFLRTFPSEVP